MHYWLFKSEPTTFSINDLSHCPNQITPWDGVRNYQVRNMLRDEIKKGDLAFFYHSSCVPPGVVGIIKVVKSGYPDTSAFDPKSKYHDPMSLPDKPRWFMVDVKLVKKFPRLMTLNEIKNHPKLKHMMVARRGNRLSITPVTQEEWDEIINYQRRRQCLE